MLLATVALSQIPPPSFGIAAPPTFLQLDAAPGYVDGRGVEAQSSGDGHFLGPTLFDKDFTLDELKAAAAAE